MEINFFQPNPAIAQALLSPEMRIALEERIHMAQMLYQAHVAKRTGKLAASAHAHVEVGGIHNDRLVGYLTVGDPSAPYGASHELGHLDETKSRFYSGHHELNHVLDMLSGI